MNPHYAGTILTVGFVLGVGAADLPQALQYPVQSASGQFSARIVESGNRSSRWDLEAIPSLLQLDPTLLTVSAERLKQHLAREIGDSTPWQGRVLFSLRPTESFEAPARLVADWQGNGWQYRVSLPDYMERGRFLRTLVEVNLMEMANRNSAGRTVEVPAWLAEGLTGHLLASRSVEIILPPPKLNVRGMNITPWLVENRHYQPLAQAHAQLQTNAPLSIEQLSWPTPDSFTGRRGQTYRNCSQLLVLELLRLPDGPEMLNTFIRTLSRHYNWQMAFLDAYQARFPSLLDFEKWWALQVAHFTGRELSATYTYADSVLRLYQAVHLPVQVRLQTNDLPMLGEVRLQTIIEEWDTQRQQSALEQSLANLTLLRARITPELIALLDDYRLTLQYYLRNRNRSGIYFPRGINRQVALSAFVRRTLQTLNRLDAELIELLPTNTEGDALAESRD